MEALKNSLATLVALEARVYDLVDPATQIAEAVKGVLKEAVVVIEHFEARLAALESHPAVAIPALEVPAKTEAPVASVTSIDSSPLPSSVAAAAPPALFSPDNPLGDPAT